MNSSEPEILKILCDNAVRCAFFDCPMQANSAVMVVPILSPNRIGIAPSKPRILLTPSGPAVEAKFCSTAMVAELLCTTTVIKVPTSTPKTGIPDTC